MRLTVQATNLRACLDRQRSSLHAAAAQSVADAARGLRDELRQQVKAAGLGGRLANTWRLARNGHNRYAGLVYTTAPKIMQGFNEAGTIRSDSGLWLALPGPQCPPRINGRKPTPELVERSFGQPLRLVYRRGKPGLLVMNLPQSGREAVMFILLPQVRRRKRLDIEAAARRWQQRMPALLAANWRSLRKADFSNLSG